MGDRGEVSINGVYLYTHWGGKELIEDVKKALNERARWDDEEYLARIIFCKMVGDDMESTTGYGIGNIEHSDAWRQIIIKDQHIIIKRYDKIEFEGTFEEFLEEVV